jgi:hypothetical protein
VALTGVSHVNFAAHLSQLQPGLRGRAWIRADSQSLAVMLWRWVCETFQR